jgi:hypothetical protein
LKNLVFIERSKFSPLITNSLREGALSSLSQPVNQQDAHLYSTTDGTTKAIGTPHLCGSPRQAEKVARPGTLLRLCRINAAFLAHPVTCRAVVLTRCAHQQADLGEELAESW